MNWFFKEDKTAAILTAEQHIVSMHIEKKDMAVFPKTAILFYMHGGEDYLCQNYGGKLMMEKFPRFLRACPVYSLNEKICFLAG